MHLLKEEKHKKTVTKRINVKGNARLVEEIEHVAGKNGNMVSFFL